MYSARVIVTVESTDLHAIDGVQSISRDSNDKDVAAMLGERTIEASEESFVIVLQHGGNDVTCKRSIPRGGGRGSACQDKWRQNQIARQFIAVPKAFQGRQLPATLC